MSETSLTAPSPPIQPHLFLSFLLLCYSTNLPPSLCSITGATLSPLLHSPPSRCRAQANLVAPVSSSVSNPALWLARVGASAWGSWASSVVWTSLGPLPLWVPGPTTRWAPRTTRLALHDTCWREAQELRRRSTRIGSCTSPALYRRLLDILDLYSLPEPTCNPSSQTI
jgi:hypothetical protein